MEQKINKVNYKSDFDFTAVFKAFGQGGEVEIGFANYDWEIVLTTGCNHFASKGYVVSYKGGVCTNCFNDNSKVHIVMNDHKLGVGQIQGVVKANIPNPIYPDGYQLLMHNVVLPFELVTDNGDAPSEVEVEILLPYLYDSAYRIAVASGYKGTQEEYYQLASQLPNAVETAMKIQGTADSLAESVEQIGGAIETLASTTDAIEQGANVIKDNADTLQASATIVKASSEQIGGSIADLQASVSSIDGAVEGINQGASTIATSATKVETSATTLEGVSATINSSATSLADSAEQIGGKIQSLDTSITNIDIAIANAIKSVLNTEV
jgi:prefoldin subunit 5